jgi:hypothetical protein
VLDWLRDSDPAIRWQEMDRCAAAHCCPMVQRLNSGCDTAGLASRRTNGEELSLDKMSSGLNAFEISDIQEGTSSCTTRQVRDVKEIAGRRQSALVVALMRVNVTVICTAGLDFRVPGYPDPLV